MAPRPTDIRAVAELLQQEHPDAEALARAVITKIDELRAGRLFTVALVGVGEHTFGYGPWSTPAQAQKAVDRGTVPALAGSRVGTVTVYPIPTDDGAAPSGCPTCPHPRPTHNWPKRADPGCVVRGCDCRWGGK